MAFTEGQHQPTAAYYTESETRAEQRKCDFGHDLEGHRVKLYRVKGQPEWDVCYITYAGFDDSQTGFSQWLVKTVDGDTEMMRAGVEQLGPYLIHNTPTAPEWRYEQGTARLGQGEKVHHATAIYSIRYDGAETFQSYMVKCRTGDGQRSMLNKRDFIADTDNGEGRRAVTCGACRPQPRRTEEFYKLFPFPDGRDRRVGFSACRAHTRKLTGMLGEMNGATLDYDEYTRRDEMDPCIICEAGEQIGTAGLVGLLAHRIIWTGTTLSDTTDF